jgi:hypothetical protein
MQTGILQNELNDAQIALQRYESKCQHMEDELAKLHDILADCKVCMHVCMPVYMYGI